MFIWKPVCFTQKRRLRRVNLRQVEIGVGWGRTAAGGTRLERELIITRRIPLKFVVFGTAWSPSVGRTHEQTAGAAHGCFNIKRKKSRADEWSPSVVNDSCCAVMNPTDDPTWKRFFLEVSSKVVILFQLRSCSNWFEFQTPAKNLILWCICTWGYFNHACIID